MEYRIDAKTLVRFAREDESALILRFIKDLAQYEGMLDQVTATEELLRETIFRDKRAEVLFCEYEGAPVGFALFFHNYSTFLGRPGLYLEDIYVAPGMRGKGIGRSMLSVLGRIALDRNCGRMEWWCLDWNKESIAFYRGLGAEAMSDWTVYRLTEEKMQTLADRIDAAANGTMPPA